MSWLEAALGTPVAAALARTLLHSLWEGACVALALAIVLCFARTARIRYAAACVAMVVLVGGLVVTFSRLSPTPATPTPIATVGHFASERGENAMPVVGAHDAHPIRYTDWVVPFWIMGVFVFYVRGLAGWIATWRLRRVGVCRAPDAWLTRIDRLRSRLRLSRAVVLMESSLAEVPVVMGYLRPVILMPVGLMAGIPVAQVEAILLHELAHIRRYDYVVNLLQVFAEGSLFYHPAVWWISGVMRIEREYCCDDLVVAATGGTLEYASALTVLEQRRVNRAVLAATDGSLVKRVERLLGHPRSRFAPAIPVLTAAVLTVSMVAAMMALPREHVGAAAVSPRPVPQAPPLFAQATSPAAPPIAPRTSPPRPVASEPVEAAPATPGALPDRTVAPNDVLSISISDAPDVSRPAIRVGADGDIRIPLLENRMHVEGLLPGEIETKIARALIDEMILLHPKVAVSILEYARRFVTVVGDVKIPGQFQITAPITLLEAMAKAGWVTPFAGPDLLFSTRVSAAPQKINIEKLQTDASLNVVLNGGEVISVPDAPKVWVTGPGSVVRAVPVRNPADATVLKVIASVEGLTQYYNNNAYIYRADETGKRKEIVIPLKDIMHRKAPDVQLQADDILLIPDDHGIQRRGLLEQLQREQLPLIDPPAPNVRWVQEINK